jgi:hypothetical protein
MMRRCVLMLLAAAVTTGCATTGGRAYMDAPLSSHAEPATVWNRPQEVGFTWTTDVQGEASHQCVLYVLCWGSEGGGVLDGLTTIVGGVLGRPTPVSDPLVRAAAAAAIKSTANTDGIYVVTHDTEAMNFIVFQKRTAKVRGKGFTLHPIGEVSQERVDKYRNLSALGSPVVHLPPEVVK